MTRRTLRRAAGRRGGALAGAALLAGLLWWQGPGAFLDGLRSIDGRTLLAALAIGLFTTVLSAWRWCLVARGLHLRLSLGPAVADYYRALFLNAALPAGVLGDVHRAVRHGQGAGDVGRGVRAVVLERTAGQAVLVLAGGALLLAWPAPALTEAVRAAGRTAATPHTVVAALGAALLAVLLAVCALRLRGQQAARRCRRVLRTTLTEARRGLLGRGIWPGVVLTSVAVLAGHLGMFLLAARAAGVAAPAADLLPLMLLALLAMALPLNVAGWGPREGVTAWAFSVAGMGTAQGLTVAVVYGLLALAASLPGLAVLLVQGGRALRRPQRQLEERVLAQDGAAQRRPERVPHPLRAGETEPGDAVAEQDRRHGEVEPVQCPRPQEPRHRDAPALHQHPAQTAPRELAHQAPGGERTLRQGQYLHARCRRRGRSRLTVAAGPPDPQRGR